MDDRNVPSLYWRYTFVAANSLFFIPQPILMNNLYSTLILVT